MFFHSDRHEARALPSHVRLHDVACRTRHAARAFIASDGQPWTHARLRSWLIVEYGMATEWSREAGDLPWLADFARLDDRATREMVDDARRRIVRLLRQESPGWQEHRAELAREMVARGLVTCVADCTGSIAHAPAARADLGFVERVASLFLADFLSHPDDYRDLEAGPFTVERDRRRSVPPAMPRRPPAHAVARR